MTGQNLPGAVHEILEYVVAQPADIGLVMLGHRSFEYSSLDVGLVFGSSTPVAVVRFNIVNLEGSREIGIDVEATEL